MEFVKTDYFTVLEMLVAVEVSTEFQVEATSSTEYNFFKITSGLQSCDGR